MYKLRLHYLEIPVLLQLSLKKNIFFRTGFGFGYLIKASENFGQGIAPGTEPFRSFEWSGQLGAGFNLNKSIGLNVCFSYSLLPVRITAGDAVFFGNNGQFNKVLALQLFYKIG